MTEEKPATDRRIERARVALSKEHYTERLWHSDFVKALIARIDTERTARLAAEARVKALEDALKEAAAEIRRLREEARNRRVDLGGVLELLLERNGKVDLTSDVVSQVRNLLATERRAGIEAAATHLAATTATRHLADEVRALADALAPDKSEGG